MEKRKLQINLTDSSCDLDRFASGRELEELLEGFDGIELMHLEEDERGIISVEMVVGYHITQPQYWLDLWGGDLKRCEEEFDTLDKARGYYGGLNQALPVREDGPLLLLENLWQPGLTFQDPGRTAELIDGIRYPRKGFMLDTGHLIHTNPKLRTQKEAVQYIHQCLDAHGSLCRYIKGVHLNQSITGTVMNRYRKHPPVPAATYEERTGQLFEYVFRVDRHQPFTGAGVSELVDRIEPDYVTCEFISNNLEEHKRMLKRQMRLLGREII